MALKRICVYCGSSNGKDPAYTEAATDLGRALHKSGIGLVYGGAAVGVMGAIADSILEAGGEAIGVIPKSLALKEVAHEHLTELHVVDTMHQRKAMMAELSDGFIALPGGWGTLEELFEMLTWAQLGFHNKPCGILNIKGYYDGLIEFLNTAFEQQFVKEVYRPMLLTADNADDLLALYTNYHAPRVRKWVSEEQL